VLGPNFISTYLSRTSQKTLSNHYEEKNDPELSKILPVVETFQFALVICGNLLNIPK
jgi:hypothetical protein